MNIDLYTKAILTVIAICLVILTLQNSQFIPVAHAQRDRGKDLLAVAGYVHKVQIVGTDQDPHLRWEKICVIQ